MRAFSVTGRAPWMVLERRSAGRFEVLSTHTYREDAQARADELDREAREGRCATVWEGKRCTLAPHHPSGTHELEGGSP